jgi:carbon-monoxide dehydrogenase small subunit
MLRRTMSLSVNGATRRTAVRPHDVLLDTLREDLNLTGTKRGCDRGTCGCCTVWVDGEPRLSCLTLTWDVEGREVTTVEGLRGGRHELHPLQRLFAEVGGSQCGFCTPGFLMTSAALIRDNPDPSDDEIRQAISGNLCRCTGYQKIVQAIREAAREAAGAPAPTEVAPACDGGESP